MNTSLWTWVAPAGESDIALNGTTLQITEHANTVHDAWAPTGNNASRIVQPITNTDFDVAAKFVSDLDWANTSQGIVVEQGSQNYLCFEFRTDGTQTSLWAGSRAGTEQKVLLNSPLKGYAPLWLRVTRSADSWTVSWSSDGNQYTQAGSFQYALAAATIGLYASNNSPDPENVPAFTASVDSFQNLAAPVPNQDAPPPFARIVIDPNPGTVLAEETMGDLDGDGRPDVVVGFEDESHGIVWYRSPHSGVLTDHWDRFAIVPTGQAYEDLAVFDVNGDGANDVIASIDGAIKWYENPLGHGGNPTTDSWQEHIVNPQANGENNLVLTDLDGDGQIDIITSHTIYFRDGPDSWQAVDYNPGFRGLALLDIGSGKGAINLLGSSPDEPYSFLWFENPRESGGNARTGKWISHYIGPAYVCDDPPSCYGAGSVANLASGDLNGDGRMDLVTVQSEGYPVVPAGGMMWFEAPEDRRQPWIQHTIDADFQSAHNVWVADIDKNGTMDVIAAEQEQAPGRRVSIFFNDGKGNFSMQILSNTGSHNPFLTHIDGDGWLDLLSAGHGRFGAPNPVELYMNPRGGFRPNLLVGVWRPRDGTWLLADPGYRPVTQWGLPGDVPVPADYDGDGKIDIAVWRPVDGTWYVIPSAGGAPLFQQWGLPGDIPVPGDYDGVGHAEWAVWRPSEGNWYLYPNQTPVHWGAPGDIPVPGNYGGGAKTEIAVFRPSEGNWYLYPNRTPVHWGDPGDIPVPADYDGDHKTDIAVWRPSEGNWYFSQSGASPVQFGLYGDVPLPADYDGDGKIDLAVWRPGTGNWYIIPSTSLTKTPVSRHWGLTTDVPLGRVP